MSPDAADTTPGENAAATPGRAGGVVTVHYWASARAAAGVAEDRLPVPGPVSLTEVLRLAAAEHPGGRLAEVLAVCAVLVGDRPVSAEDPATVLVSPGDVVELLPPFAGG